MSWSWGADPETGIWIKPSPPVTGELTAWEGVAPASKPVRRPPRERYEVRRVVDSETRVAVSWHLKLDCAIAAARRTGSQQVVWTHVEDKSLPGWIDDAMVVWEPPEVPGEREVLTAEELLAFPVGTVLRAAVGDIWWVQQPIGRGNCLVGQWSSTKYELDNVDDMEIILANGPYLVLEKAV